MKYFEKQAIEKISNMLPNREKVRFFIWDHLEPPFSQEFNLYLLKNIEDYGSWKEIKRVNGILAYRGWIYKKRKQGHWIYNYKNGKLHRDCYFRNNKLHLRCQIYHEDGRYEITDFYKGIKNGEHLRYTKESILCQKSNYKMGIEYFYP